jgi:methyl-accepting chemotaxis protein
VKRLIIKTALIIFLIAAVATTLIVATIVLNKESKTDAQVLNIAGKQRMLSQRTIKETYHLISNPGRDRDQLERTIEQFETNLGDLMRGNEARGVYLPPTTDVADALSDTQKAWEELREMMQTLQQKQAQIALETENFLQMVPQLQEATEEVAFIVERRRMSRTIQQETRAQSGVLNLVILMSAAYLASAQEEHYEEFYNALKNYDRVLGSLANHDGFLHGSVLALVSDNQLLWETFQDSVLKAVEGKRTLLQMQGQMAQKGDVLLSQLERVAEAYTRHSEGNRLWLERLQYLFAAILLGVVLYALYLLWGMRDHIRHFIDHARTLGQRPLDRDTTPEPFSFDEADEMELKEAGEHLNRFVANVDELLKRANHLEEFSQLTSEELIRLSNRIEYQIQTEGDGPACSEAHRRAIALLERLKSALDDLQASARLPHGRSDQKG